MPKDKTATHKRVVEAARAEFLDKGFERASMRSIGARAGITSAGLYRHFADKEAMFSALVEDSVQAVNQWMEQHVAQSTSLIEAGELEAFNWPGRPSTGELAEHAPSEQAPGGQGPGEQPHDSHIDLFRYVIYPRREDFKLVLCCSQGTRYENYVDDLVREGQRLMVVAFDKLRAQGAPVKSISDDELHIMLSAYTTALFEPVIHDYPEKDLNHYLQTIEDFFMPGWLRIMGLDGGR